MFIYNHFFKLKPWYFYPLILYDHGIQIKHQGPQRGLVSLILQWIIFIEEHWEMECLWAEDFLEMYYLWYLDYNLLENEPLKWEKIAQQLGTRSAPQVRSHAQKYL